MEPQTSKRIKTAGLNADPDWYNEAMDTIRRQPRDSVFTTRDLQAVMFNETHDKRAWGAVILDAVGRGLVVRHTRHNSRTYWRRVGLR